MSSSLRPLALALLALAGCQASNSTVGDSGRDAPIEAAAGDALDVATDGPVVDIVSEPSIDAPAVETAVDSATLDTATDTSSDNGIDVANDAPMEAAQTDAPPDVIGAPCTDNSMCNSRSYCAGTGCGTAGTCQYKPTYCAGVASPVCGCDNVTYPNLCTAHKNGVRVDTTGACVDGGVFDAGADSGTDAAADAIVSDTSLPPGSCLSGADCNTGEYCAKPLGMCDAVGTCMAQMAVCPAFCVLECGCDGMNYCNDCLANNSGTTIAHAGACGDGGI